MSLRHTVLTVFMAAIFGTMPALAQTRDGQTDDKQSEDGQKPKITWISIDWQPAWIHEGPLKGLGYAQTVERMLRERLTGYEHQDRSVTNVRIYSVLQNRDACFAASPYQGSDLLPDNKRGVIWSAPAYIFFYHGIIARPDVVAKIKKHAKEGYVNFESLIADESLTGAFQPRRSYSQWLNPILADEEKTKHLFKWSGDTQLTQSMFKLLAAKRIDYFIDYVIMLKYHQASTGTQSEYVYLPIEEHKNLLGLGSIACSDTPLGRKIIADINEVLKDIRLMPEVREANRRWLMPEEQKEAYWHMWETELLPLEK